MSQNNKPRILIFCDYYLPGFKSGGGMRTLVNMVDRLGDKFDFRIVTRDHDGKSDKTPYPNVKINGWNEVGKAKVYYIAKDKLKLENIKKLVEEVKPKSIYTNSYFSTFTIFILLLRRFRRLPVLPIIVAPEGELSPGSLNLKQGKKKLYFKFARALNLYENIVWKATADFEKSEIERVKGKGGKIFIAPNMPPKQIFPEFKLSDKPSKKPGEMSLIYLSRLHPVKNLKFLLEILPSIQEKISLDIFGPIDNQEYVQECRELIEKFPPNLSVSIKGEVKHEDVTRTLEQYHFFVLPTTGESFGHIIVEALASGCPLIISNKTPWLNLQDKNIGWDLPLEETSEWLAALKYCINLNADQYIEMAGSARNYLNNWLNDESNESATEKILNYTLNNASSN